MVVAGDSCPVLPKLQTLRRSHEVADVLQSSQRPSEPDEQSHGVGRVWTRAGHSGAKSLGGLRRQGASRVPEGMRKKSGGVSAQAVRGTGCGPRRG